ncbi:MAG: DUF4157 domain-containing protein [Kofleriaceae bacterium]|nr:DUF4157 domain-containing protein [Kofleriaceae bacterium]MBP9166411.1 DUF4157 domain-containing protein [Kofleriaceae bacterium]MBP9858651.1 DUF4157 domain-containing protein [Kofleriaceae bacterium]
MFARRYLQARSASSAVDDLAPGRRTQVAARYAPRSTPPPPAAADLSPARPPIDLDAAFSLHLGDAVQRRADGDAPAVPGEDALTVARAGVAGGGGALPHGDTIARAFGPDHDLSSVRAHVGGAAAAAARGLGAMAYATGHDVAFADEPDLFTAAHEAAHVVQQRHGVALRGGVGAAGDRYEREADAVAEAVVAGRSAAPLLAGYRDGGGAPAVQRRAPDSPDLRPGELALQRILAHGTLAEVTAMVAALKRARLRRPEAGSEDAEVSTSEPDRVELLVAGATQTYDVARRSTSAMIRVGTVRLAELSGAEPDPRWAAFAQRWNEHFGAVSHAFDLDDDARTASASDVAAIRLQYLFTDVQRALLELYFATKLIPEGLFNGSEIGRTTAQQRIILSSKILAEGTYRPGSFDQRVHAQACFHWVRIVHHYAGATSRGLGTGYTGDFDHAGHVVLATGETETEFQSKRDGDLEAPEGTAQANAHGDAAWRFRVAPWSEVLELEPGDWVYLYNGNKSVSGAHSVIFAGWAGPAQTDAGRHLRPAHVFDQGAPTQGGTGHVTLLGDDFFLHDGRSVKPVNHIMRVNPEAAPADSIDALTPDLSKKVAKRNHAFVKKVVAHNGGGKRVEFDVAAMNLWLRTQTAAFIDDVAAVPGRLDDEQVALLRSANASDDNHTLVCLFERLRELAANSAALAANTAAKNAQLDPRHAEATAAKREHDAALKAKTDPLEAELVELAAQRDPLEERLAEIDNSGVIRELRDQVLATKALRTSLPEDYTDARAYLRLVERSLVDRIVAEKAVRAPHKQEIKALKNRLKPLTRRERIIDARLDALHKKAAKEDPTRDLYSLVHGGSRKGTIKEVVDGDYGDLPKDAPWAEWVRPVAG